MILIVRLAALLLVVGGGLWAWATYNGLVRRKQLVAEAYAGVDVQLRRRHDLVPRLVEAVKAYRDHEAGTLEAVTAARADASGGGPKGKDELAAQVEHEVAVTRGLRSLLAVAEAYPELKASARFADLQAQLVDTEDQLQLARRYYNGAVRDLNTAVEQFPSNLLAGVFGFASRPYFEVASAVEREAVAVGMDR